MIHDRFYFIPLPFIVSFEPINLCNAKCFCCPYTKLSEDKTYHGVTMPREKISQLINDYGSLIKKYNVPDYFCQMQPWRYSDPLVQPDLDYILELCNKHKIRIMLTTNAVSFTKKVCDILNQHHGLISQIFVSVIGFTDEEVWDMMKIKKQKTLKSLEFLKDNYPNLSRKLRIGIKHKDQNAYAPTDVIYEYKSRTYGKVKAKRKWMSNRLGDGDGDWTKPYNATVLEDYFIEGCAMNKGRIMRQMEVLVNGQVLLCCDDADGKTNYGNVFEIGIENAWKNLQKEHTLIYDKKFSDAKKDLICNTCSRGRFTGYWTEDQEQKAIKKQKSIASLAGL